MELWVRHCVCVLYDLSKSVNFYKRGLFICCPPAPCGEVQLRKAWRTASPRVSCGAIHGGPAGRGTRCDCWQGSQGPGSGTCCQVLGGKGKARGDGIKRGHTRKKETKEGLRMKAMKTSPRVPGTGHGAPPGVTCGECLLSAGPREVFAGVIFLRPHNNPGRALLSLPLPQRRRLRHGGSQGTFTV